MKALLLTSKFWNYIGMALSVATVAVSAMATHLGNEEMESKIVEKVTNTLSKSNSNKESV